MQMDRFSKSEFATVIEAIDKVFDVLDQFRNNPGKRLNLTKLFNYYKIYGVLRDQILSDIMEFWEISLDPGYSDSAFSRLAHLNSSFFSLASHVAAIVKKARTISISPFFQKYLLHLKKEKGQYYVKLKEKSKEAKGDSRQAGGPQKKAQKSMITLTSQQYEDFNQIYYLYRKLRRGKGLDISNPSLEISKKIKDLMALYPELFVKNGGDLVYLTELSQKLGEKIKSQKIINRVSDIEIDSIIFKIVV